MKANTKQLNGIGAFCDDMRDALRGPFSDDHKGGFLIGEPTRRKASSSASWVPLRIRR